MGGAGGCVLGTAQGCGTGLKCTIADPITGDIDCLPEGIGNASTCTTGDTCASLPTPVFSNDNTEYGECIIS